MSIHQAAKERDIGQVQLVLDAGQDPNAQDEQGFTALAIAAANGDTNMIQLLLQQNIDPNIPNQYQVTPLMLAALKHPNIVQELLNANADCHHTTCTGATFFSLQIMRNNFRNLTAGTEYKETALTVALKHDNSSARIIFRHMADGPIPNYPNIFIKLLKKNWQLILDYGMQQRLQQHNPDLETMIRTNIRRFPKLGQIFNSISINILHPEIFRAMLQAGVNFNQKVDHAYPIHQIAQYGRVDLLDMCHEHVNLNARNLYKDTPLMVAAEESQDEIVVKLIEYGAKTDLRNSNGDTALTKSYRHAFEKYKGAHNLFLMVRNRKLEPQTEDLDWVQKHQNCTMALIHATENNEQLEKLNKCEYNVLMEAAKHNDYEIVKLLLERGVNPNIIGRNGDTALRLACYSGCLSTIRLLAQYTNYFDFEINLTFFSSSTGINRMNPIQEHAYAKRYAMRDVVIRFIRWVQQNNYTCQETELLLMMDGWMPTVKRVPTIGHVIWRMSRLPEHLIRKITYLI